MIDCYCDKCKQRVRDGKELSEVKIGTTVTANGKPFKSERIYYLCPSCQEEYNAGLDDVVVKFFGEFFSQIVDNKK